METPILQQNQRDDWGSTYSFIESEDGSEEEMLQAAGNFLSYRNMLWFLMMMKNYFWNIDFMFNSLHIEPEDGKEEEMFQVAGNCLYIESRNCNA